MSEYIANVEREWEWWLSNSSFSNGVPTTFYMGGGTPSLVSPEHIHRWIEFWKARGLPESAEITLEANPEDVHHFSDFRQAGVTRLSIGCQSHHDDELKQLGRTHTNQMIIQAVDHARNSNFNSISCDYIYALPFSTSERWESALQQAIALQTDHISCYALTVEEHTAFGVRKKRGEFSEVPDERVETELMKTFEQLESAGYNRYELSNFAKPGHESKHNLAYWQGIPYIGSGPSAHGYDGQRRFANPANYVEWVNRVKSNSPPFTSSDELTIEQHRSETITLQLRLRTGLDLDNPLLKIDPQSVERIISQGWATLSNHHLVLTSSGLIRESAISAYLI